MIALDKKEREILRVLQENCRKSIKQIASDIKAPISTVHTKIKRLEEEKVILGYKAVVSPKLVDKGTCAFVLIAFSPRENISQHDVASKLKLRDMKFHVELRLKNFFVAEFTS
ncbi:MAG: Lrp/AsnC family transcriptional regulator [Candidatus Thermoplasmatota archaeon]